ncbi:MAG: methyltransferase domain-containing protein [Myxococcaceae bacterium]|nr:methyltransferase domain-containing protein [Myxococcaceae bacterium]
MRSESFGESWKPTVVDRFGVWLSSRAIKRWVPTFAGKRVGDFGCGFHASFSRTLVGEVQSLVLADVSLSPELKTLPEVRTLEGALPGSLDGLESGSLDVALCVSVLEHLWDAKGMLKQLHRLLAPGGVALLNVPSWRGKTYLELSAFKLGLSPKAEMDDHKAYYDVKDLWPLLVEAGFLPSRIHCFAHKFGLNTFAACER